MQPVSCLVDSTQQKQMQAEIQSYKPRNLRLFNHSSCQKAYYSEILAVFDRGREIPLGSVQQRERNIPSSRAKYKLRIDTRVARRCGVVLTLLVQVKDVPLFKLFQPINAMLNRVYVMGFRAYAIYSIILRNTQCSSES